MKKCIFSAFKCRFNHALLIPRSGEPPFSNLVNFVKIRKIIKFHTKYDARSDAHQLLKTTQTLSGSVWKFAYGASDSVSGRHRWVRARDRVNEWLTPLVDFIIILACFIIINQRRVISKISKSFVSALVGLGSFQGCRRLSTVSYATLA